MNCVLSHGRTELHVTVGDLSWPVEARTEAHVHLVGTRSLESCLIERTPGVVGGSARITRTRIPVWALEGYRRLGWTDERILAGYPTLRRVDLRAAWEYVAGHPEEVATEIRENESA